MPGDLIQLDARILTVRILSLLAIIFAAVWGWFVVRWYVGNTLAEYLNPDENTLQTARLAVQLAPNDPLAHWRLGQV
jgi:tetratricopeptide (TPR) repeat protein